MAVGNITTIDIPKLPPPITPRPYKRTKPQLARYKSDWYYDYIKYTAKEYQLRGEAFVHGVINYAPVISSIRTYLTKVLKNKESGMANPSTSSKNVTFTTATSSEMTTSLYLRPIAYSLALT